MWLTFLQVRKATVYKCNFVVNNTQGAYLDYNLNINNETGYNTKDIFQSTKIFDYTNNNCERQLQNLPTIYNILSIFKYYFVLDA